MNVNRRDFIKISGAAGVGLMLSSVFDLMPIEAYAKANPPQWENVSTSICCFCGVGCGLLVGSKNDQITYVQGNPDHPINQGSLCSKGQATGQLNTVDGLINPKRVQQPLYRAPGASSWTPVSWNDAINGIAAKIKAEYDNRVIEEWIDEQNVPVNRCETIANLGGASLDNEECYLLSKLTRAMGLVYIEHQARI